MASTPIVVIDNGSYRLRAGYPDEPQPRVNCPSLVGLPRNKGVALATGAEEYAVGQAAVEKRGLLHTERPLSGGTVTNWEQLEKLWSHVIYKQLRLTPENHCFVLTQNARASNEEKERTLEIMMETFNVHSLYLGAAPVFSLYAYGMTTGVVIDAAFDNTSVVPIHEGYALGRHITSSPVAGEALTSYLSRLLESKGYGFSTLNERDLVNTVKETMCYVRVSHVDPVPPGDAFVLPDGQSIPIEEERYQCPEAMFNHSILGESFVSKNKVWADAGHEFEPSLPKGVSWLTYAAINNCEASLRHQLFESIVLAGGSSLFLGMQKRIHSEITQLYREMHQGAGLIPISVEEMPCRQSSAWLGGSMLSTITMFPHLTVSRQEYEETGSRIIHCKCL